MALTYRDRRRLVLATTVTLVALPALWWTSRAEESAAPNVAVAGAGVGVDVGADRHVTSDTAAATAVASSDPPSNATIAPPVAAPDPAVAAPAETPTPTTVVATGTPGAAITDENDAPGAQAPVFFGGPSSNIGAGLSQIAVPAAPSIERINTTATFRTNLGGKGVCAIPGMINARTVTIVNLDTGRSVTCTTVLRRGELGDEIALPAELFSQLADLTDAPIPVEIRR